MRGSADVPHPPRHLVDQHPHLQDGWLLDRATVEKYLTKVEGMYRPNPYHNKIHAADVTQTAAVIMSALDMHLRSDGSSKPASGNGCQKCSCGPGCCCAVAAKGPAALSNGHSPAASPRQPASNSSSVSSSAEPGLSKLERFAIILASAIHDLGHPGVNNVFLVKTRDKQAIMYNDKSVNENMHASMAFSLAFDQEEFNIFKKFSATEYEQVSYFTPSPCTASSSVHIYAFSSMHGLWCIAPTYLSCQVTCVL